MNGYISTMAEVKREHATEQRVRAMDAHDIVAEIHRLEDEIEALEGDEVRGAAGTATTTLAAQGYDALECLKALPLIMRALADFNGAYRGGHLEMNSPDVDGGELPTVPWHEHWTHNVTSLLSRLRTDQGGE